MSNKARPKKIRNRWQPVETPAAERLEAELDRIAALGLDEVRALWRELTQQNAPKALSGDLLARMIAHRIQEQRLGKLSREMRKLLDRLAKGGAEPLRHLKVGTVMVREHQGTLHEVMVVPGGFSWQEKTYPSLSTIARAITGTSWNGPRFFGLRGRSGTEAAVAPVPAMRDRSRASNRSSIRSSGRASQGMGVAALRLITSVDLGRRSRRLHGREGLDDAVAMLGTGGNEPGVAGLEPDRLPLNSEFRSARDHVADRLIVAPDLLLGLWLLVLPQAKGDSLARSKVDLPHFPFWRGLAADLLDCGIYHGSPHKLAWADPGAMPVKPKLPAHDGRHRSIVHSLPDR
jgi:hypothetical protein